MTDRAEEEATGTHLVGDLAWDAVERRLAAGAFAILPVGAGAKQHGLHLPMRTDAIQAEWLAAQLADALDALIWPTVAYGHYPAFASYAGSCSLSARAFEAMMSELLAGLLGYGPRAILMIDTGISTIAPIERAVAKIGGPVLHLKVHDGPHYRDAASSLSTQRHGTHADELETSLLLALAPNLVDMDRAVAGPAGPPGAGPMQHADPDRANYSASGVIGDPTAARAETGHALLKAMLADMNETIRAWSGARSSI